MRKVVIPRGAGLAVVAAAVTTVAVACASGSSSVSGGVLGAETFAPSPSGAATSTAAAITITPAAEPTASVPPTPTAAPPPTQQPARAATPAPTPRPVVLVTSQDSSAYTIHVGTILVVKFGGSLNNAWQAPTDSNASVLSPQSVSTARGTLDASYLANRAGTATLGIERIPTCPSPSPGARTGVCGAIALNITVSVVR